MADRPTIRRCAIYTRKSSEEGLDQAYNSLAAQRDACAAYIASQKHEGWILVPKAYDDGGFSGGNLQRPALEELMQDIGNGEIDIIVVYKIDRLTRSLADFAKLTEVLDRHNVSFVAVTQQFNTSTSMGRLTLNVLLSFAQFEREVAGERIRDKIAASKRRGMWMGGHPPLGYEVKARKLVVVPEEAETVRRLFRRYLELRSVQPLRMELASSGMQSKRRVLQDGSVVGGVTFSRGALYSILKNPLYCGLIQHKGECFSGEHEPIVDENLFVAVQRVLERQGPGDEARRKLASPALLKGMVFDAQGERLQPTHCSKGRTKYRYYTSKSLLKEGRSQATGGFRVPAPDLEMIVIRSLAGHLRKKDWVAALIHSPGDVPAALQRAKGIAAEIERQPITNTGMIGDLVARITMDRRNIHLRVNRDPLVALLIGRPPEETQSALDGLPLEIDITSHLLRCGKQMRLVIDKTGDHPDADPHPRIVGEILRARRWFDALSSGQVPTIAALSRAEGVSASYISLKISLAFLAPDIVEAIIDGMQPMSLTPERLKKACPLPASWEEQRAILLA
jgi:site-specific DNA recombinase